jgi:hypothetical protein
MLSNIYIENLMKYFPGFKGVYSSDNAIILNKKNESIIINFDTQYEKGSHFVAVFMHSSKECSYFDSLNNSIIPNKIHSYLQKYSSVKNCSIQIQPLMSTYCGFYCMMYIVANIIGLGYWKSIVSKFKKSPQTNDEKCIKYLCMSIKKFFKANKKITT